MIKHNLKAYRKTIGNFKATAYKHRGDKTFTPSLWVSLPDGSSINIYQSQGATKITTYSQDKVILHSGESTQVTQERY